jgi:hypothetical protein
VRLHEGGPGCLPFPVRSGLDSALLEDVADGRVRNVISDVGKRSLDSIVALTWILCGELHDEVDDHLPDSWPADLQFPVAVIPFLGDQGSVPSQDRVRREQRATSSSIFRRRILPLTANRRRWSSLSSMRFGPSFSSST